MKKIAILIVGMILLLSTMVLSGCTAETKECTACDGTGKCNRCGGTGWAVDWDLECNNCDGTGYCPVCGGSGQIPAGVPGFELFLVICAITVGISILKKRENKKV